MPGVSVTVYTRENCHLCEDAIEVLERVADEEGIDLDLDPVDVDEDPELREEYGERIPYVLIEGRPAAKYRVDPVSVRSKLRSVSEE